MTKQKDGESFSEFLTRWRNKAALMKNKPFEKDQVRMVVQNVLPAWVENLQMMNPRSFDELYDDRLQVEEIEAVKHEPLSRAFKALQEQDSDYDLDE